MDFLAKTTDEITDLEIRHSNTVRELAGHTDEQTTLHNYCFERSERSERVARIEKALS